MKLYITNIDHYSGKRREYQWIFMEFLLDVVHCCFSLSSHYAIFTILTYLLLNLGLFLLLVLLLFLLPWSLQLDYVRIDILNRNLDVIIGRTLLFSIVFDHEYMMIIFRILNMMLFFILFTICIEYFML
jgi:hypothetical protein